MVMVTPEVEFSLTEIEQTKLEEAVRLIRDVVNSVDDYNHQDERLDTISLSHGSTSFLRLAAMAIEDELRKHTFTHSGLPDLL